VTAGVRDMMSADPVTGQLEDELLSVADLVTRYGLEPIPARKVIERRLVPVVKVGPRAYVRRTDFEASPVLASRRAAQRWDQVITEARAGLVAAGYSPAVAVNVLKDVRRFARDTGTVLACVTRDDVTGWADGLAVSDQFRYHVRTSLRTFYRWAYKTGRVNADPTEGMTYRATRRKVPATWGEALAGFLRYVRASGATPETVHVRRAQLTRIAGELGPDPWQVEIDDLVVWLDKHEWSTETLRAHRAALRSFYGWAVIVGHTDQNPALGLPVVHSRTRLPRPAGEDSIRLGLLGADPRLRLMIELAASLGLRRGEVARIHSRDVQMGTDGCWWLTVHGKGDKERALPLPSAIADELRARRGWTFPGRMNGHLSPARVGELVSAALPDGVTAHKLRHRFATQAYAVDRDIFATQTFLGHASPVTTARYVAVPPASLRNLVDQVPTVPGAIAS
jgi:integrase